MTELYNLKIFCMEHKPKLLFITSRFPFPLEKGDKLRAYHLIKGLSQHFRIYLVALSDEPVKEEWLDELKSYTQEIHVFNLSRWGILFRLCRNVFQNWPFQLAYFTDFLTQRRVKKILYALQPDHIFCQMIRPAEYVKHYHHCRKTLDYMDLLSVGMERRKGVSKSFKRFIFSMESQRLKEYEQRIFHYFEFHLMISQQDVNGMPHPQRNHVRVIPNGICTETFAPVSKRNPTHDLVFVGNLSYAPNIDAIYWLCENVLQHRKDLTLLIAGANLGNKLSNYVQRFDNVTMLGWQDDIRSVYLRGKIFIAPMQIGTGLQNKVLEAMALEIPCIVSSLAAAAIPNSPVKVANSPEEVMAAIDEFLHSDHEAALVGKEGRNFVKEHYSWHTWTHAINELIRQH
ncbi:MAG: glycosyltransferase [Bacteroidota bacterium]